MALPPTLCIATCDWLTASSDRNLRGRGCNDDHIDIIGAHNERQQDRHEHGDGNGENAGKWGGVV